MTWLARTKDAIERMAVQADSKRDIRGFTGDPEMAMQIFQASLDLSRIQEIIDGYIDAKDWFYNAKVLRRMSYEEFDQHILNQAQRYHRWGVKAYNQASKLEREYYRRNDADV